MKPSPASNKTASRSQLVLLAVTLSKLSIALLITVLLGRLLEPAEFGFFALVNTLFVVGRDLLDLGTGNVAAREIIRYPGKERTILESLLGGRALLGAVLAAICLIFAMLQAVDHQRWVLSSVAAVLALMYLGAFSVVFQVRQSHEAASILDFSSQLLVLAAYLAAGWWHMPASFYPFLIVIREAIVIIGKKMLAVAMLGYNPKPKLYGNELKVFLGKALTFSLAALTYNIYFHSGTFLIWFFRPEQELGVYTAALRPIYPLLLLPWLLMVPLVPVLTKLAASDHPRFASLIKGVLLMAIGIGAVGAVSGIMLADSLIGVLYGNKFLQGALSAVAAFRLFALAFGFACITPVFATALLAEGRERSLLKLTLLGLLINLGANFYLLPKLAYLASAYSMVLTEVVVCLGGLLLLRRSLQPLRNKVSFYYVLYPAVFLGFFLLYLSGPQLLKVFCGFSFGLAAVCTLWISPVSKQLRRELSRETRPDIS